MTDAQWGEFAKGLLGTGVIKGALIGGSAGNDLAVTAPGSGMTVNLGTGQAMVYGHWCQNDASAAQTITASDPTNPRIDRVVLKHDVTAKTVSIVVKAGTPAPSPTAPSLTQTPSTWEMSLCQVRVNATVTAISSGNITDERTYAAPALHAATHASGGTDPITPANIGAAALTGATFTGAIQATNITATGGITASAANANIELGAKASANTPFLDFNSSGNSNDYDVRVIASGGSASAGQGTLSVNATLLQRNGNTIWDSGNDGSGSGLDADTLDGHQPGSGNGLDADTVDGKQAAAFALVGTHSAGQVIISYGTGAPAALAANEIYIQLS